LPKKRVGLVVFVQSKFQRISKCFGGYSELQAVVQLTMPDMFFAVVHIALFHWDEFVAPIVHSQFSLQCFAA